MRRVWVPARDNGLGKPGCCRRSADSLRELTSRGRSVPPPARRTSADDIRGVDEQHVKLARHPPERCRPANSPAAASQADEAICLFDEPSYIRWSHPPAAESSQVIVGGPTGHRASLSDVDGHLMLAGLGEQVAGWWYTNTLGSRRRP